MSCLIKAPNPMYKPTGASYVEMVPWTLGIANSGSWANAAASPVPNGAVMDVIVFNKSTVGARLAGVREYGSSLTRTIDVCETRGSGAIGNGAFRFLVTVNSGVVQCYAENYNDISFVVVGYWLNRTWVEQWDVLTVGSADDNAWFTLTLSNGANKCHDIIVTNDVNYVRAAGSREVGSSHDRKQSCTQSSGGKSGCNFFTNANASKEIQVFFQAYAANDGVDCGYWDDDVTFEEDFYDITNTSSGWETRSIGSRITTGSFAVDIIEGLGDGNTVGYVGARNDPKTHSRYIDKGSTHPTSNDPSFVNFTCEMDAGKAIDGYTETTTTAAAYYLGCFY